MTKRKVFNESKKLKITLKTNGLCGHCGINEPFHKLTVDHFIPISKRGTNDLDNLVALCKDCNENKDDKVCYPISYYPYLNHDEQLKLKSLYDSHLKDFNEITKAQILPMDIFTVETKTLPTLKCKIQFTQTREIKKAYYKDLNKIYNFLIRYYETIKETIDVYNLVDIVYTTGNWFYYENTDNEIELLFRINVEPDVYTENKFGNLIRDTLTIQYYLESKILNDVLKGRDWQKLSKLRKREIIYYQDFYYAILFQFSNKVREILIEKGSVNSLLIKIATNSKDLRLIKFIQAITSRGFDGIFEPLTYEHLYLLKDICSSEKITGFTFLHNSDKVKKEFDKLFLEFGNDSDEFQSFKAKMTVENSRNLRNILSKSYRGIYLFDKTKIFGHQWINEEKRILEL